MRKGLLLLVVTISTYFLSAQQLPNLPIPIGAANAEVWNNNIYLFGGSNNWSGSIVYPRVYRFDGLNWTHHDTIPDNDLWDVETVLNGDFVYLLGAWPSGPSRLRRYNLNTGEWTYLADSPNLSQDWGLTAEVINGKIYLFNSNGDVFEYDIAGNTWNTKTANMATGTWDMASILYQNEIYILGWSDSAFYKYTPQNDQWTRLANSLYRVGACAIGDINNLIYVIGGNLDGGSVAAYNSVMVYDINTNMWALDDLELSSKRHWMTTATYLGGLYVVGGIDSTAAAVDIVEQIVPQGTVDVKDEEQTFTFYLSQNYPNPFNPRTTIKFEVPESEHVSLKIYDLLGVELTSIFNGFKPAGQYEISFDGSSLPSGIYFYRLSTNNSMLTRKMMIIK